MKDYRNLLLDLSGDVLIVTVNRPEVRNALNWETWQEFTQLADEIDAEASIRGVIVTGAGEKAFAAGADVRSLREQTLVDALRPGVQGAVTRWSQVTKPVIAAINGFALGGGCELAMACDIRIASERAKLGMPETGVGIMPGGGGTQLLPRLVGKGKAKELIFTGEIIDAAEAEKIGLVNRVVPHEELIPAAQKMMEKILARAPLAIRLAKKVIDQGMETDLATGLALEKNSQAFLYATEDRMEGMNALLEKRIPRFKGR